MANPGFASGTELSNIKILTDGGEHMEGCYLHNPATPPGRAEPKEAPARPRARVFGGVLLPHPRPPSGITCLFSTTPGSLRVGICRGCDFREGREPHIEPLGLYLLQSTVEKKPRAERSEGDAFGENSAVSLRIWGFWGVGFTPFTPLPLWRGLASLPVSLKY